jgi:hypothetical protein
MFPLGTFGKDLGEQPVSPWFSNCRARTIERINDLKEVRVCSAESVYALEVSFHPADPSQVFPIRRRTQLAVVDDPRAVKAPIEGSRQDARECSQICLSPSIDQSTLSREIETMFSPFVAGPSDLGPDVISTGRVDRPPTDQRGATLDLTAVPHGRTDR